MKAKILVGSLAALIYGNAALAQDESTQEQEQEQQSPDNLGGSGLEDTDDSDLLILEQEDVAPAPVTPDTGMQEEGVGGAGPQGQSLQQPKAGIPMQGQGGVTLYCTPVQQQGATGGSGEPQGEIPAQPQPSEVEVGQVPVSPEPVPLTEQPVPFAPEQEAIGGAGVEYAEPAKPKADMRGLSVMAGGGIEGYTGEFAPNINPGPSASVVAAIKPSSVLGLELGYSGAINNLEVDVPGGGPDIVRNGAVAALTFGLTATPLQPYVLGGYGLNWYNVNNGEELGYRDDTSSRIPVGVGLRTHLGHVTADARVNYNVLISEDFAPIDDTADITNGSYNGTINIGGTF